MRFITICGGLLPDCFMAQFTIFFNATRRIHRCPQNRMSDARPQHRELYALIEQAHPLEIYLFYMILSEVIFKWMVFSKGWFCIRVHCSINVCFRLLTTGWYIVAKGKMLSLAFSLEAKITSERDRSTTVCSQALFEFHKALAKCCVWRVSSKQSHCFALN